MKRKRKRSSGIATLSPMERLILEGLQSGKGLQESLAPLVKRVMEAALDEEIECFIEEEEQDNRRNGKTAKKMKSSSGDFELLTPRDRNGDFEPRLVKKRQTILTDDLDKKILNLYMNGMSYADIRANLEEIYHVDISDAAISRITDRLLSELEEWRSRPLESVYTILFLDAIHFKVRQEGRVVAKAIYTLMGVDTNGRKDILGLYANEAEGANFWAEVLAGLKARGVQDILIACVDGLKGFPEAIHALFPRTEIQLCIVHQIRNSMRYVASKDQKEFMADLKKIYKAPTKTAAENSLLELDETWRKKYPLVVNSWQNNWEHLSHFFQYDEHIRKLIYTTNPIEGVHRMIRKYTKSKGAFTSENALYKLVFSAYKKILSKWNQPIQNWALIVSQLDIHFPKRVTLTLNPN